MFLQPPPPHGRLPWGSGWIGRWSWTTTPNVKEAGGVYKVILKIGVTPRKQALSNMTINQPEVKCPAFGQQLWIWKEAEAVHKLILEIEVTQASKSLKHNH